MIPSASSIPLPLVAKGYPRDDFASLNLPIRLDNPGGCSAAQPITLGIPLPRGTLIDPDGVGLLDREGHACRVQTQPLAHWSDGSVKWLLLDFVLREPSPEPSVWTLYRSGSEVEQSLSSSLQIEQTGSFLTINTGAATFTLGGGASTVIRQVVVDGKDVLADSAGRILLTDARGQGIPLQIDHLELEARGPVRATVRLEGHFPGRPKYRFVARACCFAGTGLLRLRLTLHNPRRARHKGGLWDLGDPGSLLFRDLSLELGLRWSPLTFWGWKTDDVSETRYGNEPLEIYQDSSGGDNWRSRNHINRHGQVTCSFRGYRASCGEVEVRGDRASPSVTIFSSDSCVTAAVPEFWQQFPKAIEVREGLLRIGLFPNQFGDLFELQGGEQKTHTVWLDFSPRGASPVVALDWAYQRAKAHLEPEWYARSQAVPFFTSAGASDESRLDAYLHDAVQGQKSLFTRREIIDEYGWRNFGEVYADHEGVFYHGPPPVLSHYNNQYDQIYGALLQYWRTSNPRWFELADPLARHVIDIDIYHTDEDRAAYNGGLFWFTDHYKDAATCTHRTYSRANCRPGERSYGGGPCSCHNFTTGLLHYFYQTGDPLAREAVVSLADWVLRMDDGWRNLLGLIDAGPTGLASGTSACRSHGPGRGAGLSINALIDGWLVSQQRNYLVKAEELIRRCVHPTDNVAERVLGERSEDRWSYTIFFSALARYLQVKAEAEELDSMYAYAQASLVHYASWMLATEKPYFDHAPKEPWPAQELRKANVLRLAAAHTEAPLRGRLLQRGLELSEGAWASLLRYANQFTARSIAIVLTEGLYDSYFRTQAVVPAPRVRHRHDFGTPEEFVPQKFRVLSQLKSFSGLCRAFLCLANPLRWWRMRRQAGRWPRF